MNGFLGIKKVKIPLNNITAAYEIMRYAGTKGVESIALFAGISDGKIFQISETIIPKQNSFRLETGLMYAVDADELHRINEWLYKNRFSIIAQIHSHPNEAYHSETDDRYPIVATIGGLSIVVPKFAFDPIDINVWAVYRLSPQNTWEELSSDIVQQLIEII